MKIKSFRPSKPSVQKKNELVITNTQEEVTKEKNKDDHEMLPIQATSSQKIILSLVLTVTLFMVALEQTITTAALPQISADLKSSEGYSWIGTGFLLASSSAMPIYGKLSDIFGRKPVVLWAIGAFVIGSVVCGAAKTMRILIGGRVIQGFGGGGIAGLCNIIISDIIPLDKRGMFVSIIGSVYMVASCIGPVVGGTLSQHGKWRWCFYMNIPIGCTAWFIMLFGLKLQRPHGQSIKTALKRIDFLGIIICTAATCLLLLALDWGGTRYPWGSPIIICFLVFSFVLYVILMLVEWKIPSEPILPPSLFLNRTRGFSILAAFFHGTCFMGIVYYLPFLFQSVYRVTPTLAATYIIPLAVCMGLTSAMGGIFVSKAGRYVEIMRVGMALTTASIGLLSTLDVNSNTARRIMYPVLFGLPLGFNFQSFLISLQTEIDKSDTAMATAAITFVRQIGLSVGIAIGGVTFMNKISSLAEKTKSLRIQALLKDSAPQSINRLKGLDEKLQKVASSLYSKAFQTMFYVFIALAGLGFIATLLIPQNELKMQKKSDIKGSKPETVTVEEPLSDAVLEKKLSA